MCGKGYFRGLLTILVAAMALSARVGAQTFNLDPAHSSIVFQIRHLDVSYIWGLAVGPAGSFIIDPADPSKSSVQVEVKTESINTGISARDTNLRGPDFFDARQFPTISFKSTSAKASGDSLEVTGDFTLHGATRPITVMLKKVGEKDTGRQTGFRAGYETSFTIKRSDFGMGGMQNIIGDEVRVFVNLEGQRR